MTVNFRGQERTLPQMAPFLEETDRAVRKEAWELSAQRRLEDRETLDDLFDQMKQLRIEIAHEAGFANFVEYAFRNRERFDYGVADTIRFQEAVEHVVVPLHRQIQEEQQQSLRRRDAAALGPVGRSAWAGPRFSRSTTSKSSPPGTETIFRDVDPELGEQFAFLACPAASRPGKPQRQSPRGLSDDPRRRAICPSSS